MARRHSAPAQPSARALEALDCYLSLGPGRSLQRCLEALEKRAQISGKPCVCKRQTTLEEWSRRDSWAQKALQYDADCRRRRAQAEAEEQRRLAVQDIQNIGATLRAGVAVAAAIVTSYINPKTGELLRKDAEMRDAAVMLKLAMEARGLLDARIPPPDPASDVEHALRTGNDQQRLRIVAAINELNTAVQQMGTDPWSAS